MGVVFQTGSMALMAWFMALVILCIRCWLLDGMSFVGWFHRGLDVPGYHASEPWSSTGSTHALTALRTALGRGPCIVLVSPRR
jgi:hypothetical protein